jgi:hypothetical protein
MFRRIAQASLGMAIVGFLAIGWGAIAGEVINAKPGGLAIQGYDPVAYFTEGRPVPGVAEYEHQWQGARWRFSKAEHLEQFSRNPRRFAPRYGGYCAGAMAGGWKAPIDPTAFAIIDGKLYLAYSQPGMDEFESEGTAAVEKADSNWARIGQVE